MSLDFQQIREQVRQLGQNAPQREERLKKLRRQACDLLSHYAHDLERLQQKVEEVVRHHDPSLRCALPVSEALDDHFSPPVVPQKAVLLAVDGSQIYLDRHAAVEYFLINVGGIRMDVGGSEPPQCFHDSDLKYGDEIFRPDEYFSEERISFLRDLREREFLAELAEQAGGPSLALIDGTIELWGAREAGVETSQTGARGLQPYLEILLRLHDQGATVAGYGDKPAQDQLVRLLEIASQPAAEAHKRPLFGVRDYDLFRDLLAPGERSAIFEFQSRAARLYRQYHPAIALHFFYLNVGWDGHPLLARVETLALPAEEAGKLEALHAVLVQQCQIMGTHRYPYILHRAHETARVTPEDKAQLDMMIANELASQGIFGEMSQKQSAKDASSERGRYSL
jgi:hypothetical protein